MEAILIKWNKKHFAQAAETPLARGRWERVLDLKDKESRVKEILEGMEVDLPSEVKECLEWVAELKKKEV